MGQDKDKRYLKTDAQIKMGDNPHIDVKKPRNILSASCEYRQKVDK